jgi:predicted transposase YbfD/YdcC
VSSRRITVLPGLTTKVRRGLRKAVIGQVRVPDSTTEVTQVRELLAGVQLAGSIVTVDAVHACTATAEYIAGAAAGGGRDADCLLAVKGN